MKEYRQNSHTFPLLFWAVLCTATAIALFIHSHRIVSRALRAEEILSGVALLILGPAALSVYLIRSRKVWVSVDDARGIVVSGQAVIPWDEVEIVQRRRPRFRKSTGPAEVGFSGSEGMASDLTNASGGCLDLGCLVGAGEFAIAGLIVVAVLFAIWILFVLFVPLLILPLLEVFAPFGDRIRILTRHHGSLILRDLRDADDFVRRVSRHRRVVEH